MSVNGHKVIDTDGHMMENEAEWRKYLPVDSEERRTLIPKDSWLRYLEHHPRDKRRADLPTVVEDFKSEGVDLSILYPTVALNHNSIREKAWAVEVARAYNDYLADYCAQSNGMLTYVALLPMQDIAAAVAELNRAVTKHQAPGAMIPAHGAPCDLSDEQFWPLYEEAQRLGVGLGVHGNSYAAPGVEYFDTFIKVHTTTFVLSIMLAMTGIILGGIPAKFPDLKLGFFEAGVGWIPFWLERMDEEWEMRRSEAPLLKNKPSEYCTAGNIFTAAKPKRKAWRMPSTSSARTTSSGPVITRIGT